MDEKRKILIKDLFQPNARFLILKFFATSSETPIALPELLDLTQLDSEVIMEHINFFLGAGVLEKVDRDEILYYRLRIEEPRVRSLKNLFDVWNSHF